MPTCLATYRPSPYLADSATLTCERTDLDDQGRHRGQHHGWEDYPATERPVSIPDPDRPGWTTWGTEPVPAGRRLWTWDRGGAQGNTARDVEPAPCPECGTPFYPSSRVPVEAARFAGSPDAYAVADQDPTTACFACRLWAERAEAYTAGWQTPPRSRGSYAVRRSSRLIRLRQADGTPSPRLNAWSEGSSGAFGDRQFTVRWDDGDQRGPASSLWDSGEIPWWLDDLFPPNGEVVRPENPTWKNPGDAPIPVVFG